MTREDLVAHFRKTRAEFLSSIEGLSDTRMTEATLDGWSPKDHLLHLSAWDDIRAQEIERISAGHATAWKMTGEQADLLNALFYPLRKELSLEQARWELAHSRERLLAAIDAASERGLDPSLYGEAPVMSGHETEHAGWVRVWRAANSY